MEHIWLKDLLTQKEIKLLKSEAVHTNTHQETYTLKGKYILGYSKPKQILVMTSHPKTI